MPRFPMPRRCAHVDGKMKEGADMKKNFWGVLQLVIGFAVMLVVGSVMIPPPPVFLPIL
jgi:hypothetical protein